MAKENEAQVVETTDKVVEETLDTQETENGQEKSYKQIIKDLIKNGWSTKKNLRIRNIVITPKEGYHMLTFVVEPPVPGFVNDGDGNYTEGVTNNIYSSTFAVSGVLKETEDLGWLAQNIIAKPKLANHIFTGGQVDVIFKKVLEGEEFVNPFSNNAEPQEMEHDTYIYYITNLRQSKNGDMVIREMRTQVAKACLDDDII